LDGVKDQSRDQSESIKTLESNNLHLQN